MELIPESTTNLQGNTVLLEQYGFWKNGRDGSKCWDCSGFSYIVEELISSSVLNIAILQFSHVNDLIDLVPNEKLKKRFIIVDKKLKVQGKTQTILAPICEELDIEMIASFFVLEFGNKLKEHEKNMLMSFFRDLYSFLLGVTYKLSVNVDHIGMKSTIDLILKKIHRKESRYILTQLKGVLNSYQQVNNSVIKSSCKDEQIIHLFLELVEDEEYNRLSEYAYLLGYPYNMKKQLIRIKAQIKQLLYNKRFSEILSQSTKFISLVSDIKLLPKDISKIIAFDGYYPPIVNQRWIISRAQSRWYNGNPKEIRAVLDLKNKKIVIVKEECTGI